jgi:cyclase
MHIVEIKPGIFGCLMDNETANAGFVVAEQGVVVVDTLDTPARGRALAAAIAQRAAQPVLFVINTHHHSDHVFGNQAFDAPLIAHYSLADELAETLARDLSPLAIAAWISQHPEDVWLAEELEVRYPNLLFDGRLVLDLPPHKLVLQHLDGHTPDSTIVDLPEEGVLYAGDLVFEGRVPYLRQANIEGTVRALSHLERLGPRRVVPGHGAVCDMAYVTRLREYLEALIETVREMIDRGVDKVGAIESDRLPTWWTEDRPDLQRANVARAYDELSGGLVL